MTIVVLAELPEIVRGDDLGALIAGALAGQAGGAQAGDVLAVAHKAVSKAEGRVRDLAEVQPSSRARELAAAHGKDPRHVQVVLDESAELLRAFFRSRRR